MKLLLYPHGGSGNHGCEAIVRSTGILTGASMTLCSGDVSEDIRYGIDSVCDEIVPYRMPVVRGVEFLRAIIRNKIRGDFRATDRLAFRSLLSAAKNVDVALSIGGDNYCYGVPDEIIFINRELRRMRVKTVLWGCSVSPEAMVGRTLDDMRAYDAVIARESVTYDALLLNGVPNVVLAPDPAFVLPVKAVPLPESWAVGNTIGINASPMIMSYSADAQMTLRNYEVLIEYIIKETDSKIALIPHVEWSHNDDRIPLSHLYEKYKDSGRMIMVDPCGAQILKYYISQCRFLVTARTHASIAAYSSGVPALVVGYSVKADGIAKDIFGASEGFVSPVSGFTTEDKLKNDFIGLSRRENEIKAIYADVMPGYIGRTFDMNATLDVVIGK